MNWIILIVAGLFEAGFAICLGKARISSGNNASFWYLGFFACLVISMYLLYLATKTIPVGTAYPVWTGIGASATVVAGIFLFKEPADFWRLFFLFTLIASVIGLRIVSR